MITIQKYVRAQSLEEAWELNQKRNNRIVGGMLWMKMSRGSVSTAIDLCDLGLDQIEETPEEFQLGAMVSLRAMELHEGLNQYSQGVIAAAVKDIVGVQFRNLATVGGSIWGRFGFSDVLSVLLSMDTYVELYKGGLIPLKQFATMASDNDILVKIHIRKTPGIFAYRTMRIQRTDFPVLTCATSILNGEVNQVVGARPGRAKLFGDPEGILKDGITKETAALYADYAAKVVPTLGNLRGSAAYRTHLVKVLTERNLMELEAKQ